MSDHQKILRNIIYVLNGKFARMETLALSNSEGLAKVANALTYAIATYHGLSNQELLREDNVWEDC